MLGKKLIQSANIWLPCTNYVFSAGLLWYISKGIAGVSKYAKIWTSVEKKWNFKYEIMASTFLSTCKNARNFQFGKVSPCEIKVLYP